MEKRNLKIDTDFLHESPEVDFGLVTHPHFTPQQVNSTFTFEKILTNYMIRNFIGAWKTLKNLSSFNETIFIQETVRKIKRNQNEGLTLDVVEKERIQGRSSAERRNMEWRLEREEDQNMEVALSRANLLQQIVDKLSYQKRTYTSREEIDRQMMRKVSNLERLIHEMYEDKYYPHEDDTRSNYTDFIANEIKGIRQEIKQLKVNSTHMINTHPDLFPPQYQPITNYQPSTPIYQPPTPIYQPPTPIYQPPLPIPQPAHNSDYQYRTVESRPLPTKVPPAPVVKRNSSQIVGKKNPSPAVVKRDPSSRLVKNTTIYSSNHARINHQPPVLGQVYQEKNELTRIPAHSVAQEKPSYGSNLQDSEKVLRVQNYPQNIHYTESDSESEYCNQNCGWF